jgi:hypothetical protein
MLEGGRIFLGWFEVGGTRSVLGETRQTYKMSAGKFCVTKLLEILSYK